VANDLAANMVSRWKLDGNTNDSWGGSNGMWNGAVAGINRSVNYRPESECVSGQCLNFDGTDDYIDFGNITSLNSLISITVSVWIYAENFTQNALLVLKNPVNSVWQLYLEGDKIKWRGGGSATVLESTKPSNANWHNIIATQTGTDANIYLDGVFVKNGTVNALGSSAGSVNIGRYDNSYYFTGSVDDVKIYDASLSSSQIKQNYIAGINSLLSNGQISKEEYNSKLSNLAKTND